MSDIERRAKRDVLCVECPSEEKKRRKKSWESTTKTTSRTHFYSTSRKCTVFLKSSYVYTGPRKNQYHHHRTNIHLMNFTFRSLPSALDRHYRALEGKDHAHGISHITPKRFPDRNFPHFNCTNTRSSTGPINGFDLCHFALLITAQWARHILAVDCGPMERRIEAKKASQNRPRTFLSLIQSSGFRAHTSSDQKNSEN